MGSTGLAGSSRGEGVRYPPRVKVEMVEGLPGPLGFVPHKKRWIVLVPGLQ